MSIVSANIQFGRGEHLLLDVTSYQQKYSDALTWARDINKNAAVGQYIYIAESETIDGVEYPKGPYIVEAYGENAVLSPLAKSIAGSKDLDSAVSALKVDVSTLKSNVGTKSTKEGEESTGLYKDIEDVNDRIDNINIPVKGITVDGETVAPDANGIVNIDLPEPEEVFAYEIAKLDKASEGAASSYQLKKIGKDGNAVAAGVTIDIPKDMVVSSGTVRTASAEEIAEDTTLIADKLYIVLTLANATEDKLFIPADKLVDVYAGSTYITVGEDNAITLNVDTLVTKLGETFYTEKEVDDILKSYATTTALSDAIGKKSTFGDDATTGSGVLKDISELEHEVELLDAATIKTVQVDGKDLTATDGVVNVVIPVKGVQVDGVDAVDENGIAKIALPEVPVKGVQVNGTDLEADDNGNVNVTIPVLDIKDGDTSLVGDNGIVNLSGFATEDELTKTSVEEGTGNTIYEGLLDNRYLLATMAITSDELAKLLV